MQLFHLAHSFPLVIKDAKAVSAPYTCNVPYKKHTIKYRRYGYTFTNRYLRREIRNVD
ncbi:hypothetical protein L3i20_v243060 [Paenibacillus sp. L3-i20]|nr:hypothetical protein L3i20_v243060 [Paenibacillus sp. L3-i20]